MYLYFIAGLAVATIFWCLYIKGEREKESRLQKEHKVETQKQEARQKARQKLVRAFSGYKVVVAVRSIRPESQHTETELIGALLEVGAEVVHLTHTESRLLLEAPAKSAQTPRSMLEKFLMIGGVYYPPYYYGDNRLRFDIRAVDGVGKVVAAKFINTRNNTDEFYSECLKCLADGIEKSCGIIDAE